MDIVDMSLKAASSNTISSYAFAFAAGVATSLGPCVAPRYAAVGLISSKGSQGRLARLAAFICGTMTVSAAIASIGSFMTLLARASSSLYLLLAAALVLSGILGLWRGEKHTCIVRADSTGSFGAAFVLGAGTSMAISPCCAPVLVSLGSLAGTSLNILCVVALVSVYTIGHIVPLLLVYGWTNAAQKLAAAYGHAATTVSAAVAIALGLYYAVLA